MKKMKNEENDRFSTWRKILSWYSMESWNFMDSKLYWICIFRFFISETFAGINFWEVRKSRNLANVSFVNYNFDRKYNFLKMYLFGDDKDFQNRLKINKQRNKRKNVDFSRKKLSRFSGLIFYLAEAFAKKWQNRENRESFCPRNFLPDRKIQHVKEGSFCPFQSILGSNSWLKIAPLTKFPKGVFIQTMLLII